MNAVKWLAYIAAILAAVAAGVSVVAEKWPEKPGGADNSSNEGRGPA